MTPDGRPGGPSASSQETGKPIAQVARDLGINEGTLGNWVNADRRRRGDGTDGGRRAVHDHGPVGRDVLGRDSVSTCSASRHLRSAGRSKPSRTTSRCSAARAASTVTAPAATVRASAAAARSVADTTRGSRPISLTTHRHTRFGDARKRGTPRPGGGADQGEGPGWTRPSGCKIDDSDADRLLTAWSRPRSRPWTCLRVPCRPAGLLYFRAVRQSRALRGLRLLEPEVAPRSGPSIGSPLGLAGSRKRQVMAQRDPGSAASRARPLKQLAAILGDLLSVISGSPIKSASWALSPSLLRRYSAQPSRRSTAASSASDSPLNPATASRRPAPTREHPERRAVRRTRKNFTPLPTGTSAAPT
jgi:transposase-like protein